MNDAAFKANVDRVKDYAVCLSEEGKFETVTCLALALNNHLGETITEPQSRLDYLRLCLFYIMDIQCDLNREIVEHYGHEVWTDMAIGISTEIMEKRTEEE